LFSYSRKLLFVSALKIAGLGIILIFEGFSKNIYTVEKPTWPH